MNTELSNLRVHYGWSVVNNIRKKIALSVLFENESNLLETSRKNKHIKNLQHTYYIRRQTLDEAESAKHESRILTEYSSFLNEKPFKGDLEAILENNYQADINNVPESILIEIKKALREGYFKSYFKDRKV